MSTIVKLYNYDYSMVKTYVFASVFILGNLLLPQLIHFVPNGGSTFLPIYFFTLIAAYKYGIRVGLLTAVLSPIINSLLFGMPIVIFLPIIVIKSSLLALAAGLIANYFGKVTFLILILVVLAYQIVGTTIEWVMLKDFQAALQDFIIGFPGMIIQIVGGYFVLKALSQV